MSFEPGFAPDAESEWRALNFELQELVLDELDRIADSPPVTPPAVISRDIAHDIGGIRHYIFLRLVVDTSRRKVMVIGVAHHSRALGQ